MLQRKQQDEILSIRNDLEFLRSQLENADARYSQSINSDKESDTVLMRVRASNLQPPIQLESVVVSSSSKSLPPLNINIDPNAEVLSPNVLRDLAAKGAVACRMLWDDLGDEFVAPLKLAHQKLEVRTDASRDREASQRIQLLIAQIKESFDSTSEGDNQPRVSWLRYKHTDKHSNDLQEQSTLSRPSLNPLAITAIQLDTEAQFQTKGDTMPGSSRQDSIRGPYLALEDMEHNNLIFAAALVKPPVDSSEVSSPNPHRKYDRVSFRWSADHIGTKLLEEISRVPGLSEPVRVEQEKITWQISE